MNQIGERIKKKRELLNLNLNELAEKVGISASALSQIEKSKSSPSIHTLKAIAEALNSSIGELVGENEPLSNNPVVLREDVKFVDQNHTGTIVFSLSNNTPNKQMGTYLVRFAQASGIEGLLTNKRGQVYCYILSGEIRVECNKKKYVLKQGDNIYFNAKLPFNMVNSYNGLSELIWVQTPPNY